MSLPISWVDKIFSKLTLVYGRQFLGRWEGLDLDAVKSDWADELSRFQQSPNAIAYALENLPADKPPTVLEFKAVCIRRPDTSLSLPSPKADPERVAAEFAKLDQFRNVPAVDHKSWARRIVGNFEAGGHVNGYPLKLAREVLGKGGAA